MANIKELKKKIKSAKGTLKITTAMKLVSAAKLAKAQQAINNARPYAEELEATIKTVSALVKDYTHPYLQERKEKKRAALLVISANKGLCGAYNSQMVKKIRTHLAESDLDCKVYFIGRKVREVIMEEVNQGKFYQFAGMAPTYLEMRQVAEGLAEGFRQQEFDEVQIAYNVFHSALSFTSTVKKVLPFTLPREEGKKLKEQFPFDFKYEPDPKTILDSLLPEVYLSMIYTALLNALAAEHGSRMAAMDNAVSNCKEAIRSLTLKMNKLRQAAITTELIEVVSGAESLNS